MIKIAPDIQYFLLAGRKLMIIRFNAFNRGRIGNSLATSCPNQWKTTLRAAVTRDAYDEYDLREHETPFQNLGE